MFIKLGEIVEISRIENSESCIPAVSQEVLDNFRKTANNLKKIAPKAEDFLYFSAVMMHAAEASSINEDGSPKLTARGEPVKVSWDKTGSTWRWTTNDPSIKPYKNCFPPGTQILMADGSVKKIEDIEAGDNVITHTGSSKKVIRKFITPHKGNLIRVKIKNNQDLVCTDNHPLYKVDFSSFNTSARGLKVLSERKKNNESFRTSFAFSKASELVVGDLLTSPVDRKSVV